MMKITKKQILIILMIFIGGCQQCILENQLHPKIGFTPQAITLNTDDYFSIDIFIDEFESPFFGFSFRIEYDPNLVEFGSCNTGNLVDSFFGEDDNYLAEFFIPQDGKIYSSVTLKNGQDPKSGSGNIAVCNGIAKSDGIALINFIDTSFYFINEFGDELINPYQNNNNYYQLDSNMIIYDFEIINARLDIGNHGIIDN